MSRRSFLYVPGDVPSRFMKALESGADAIILDLEDAVIVARKDEARQTVADWLAGLLPTTVECWVRINSGDRLEEDLQAVVGPNLTGVCVPKVEGLSTLVTVDRILESAEHANGRERGAIAVSPLIESARGLLEAFPIAQGPRVRHLQIGEYDLAADLGVVPGQDGAELLFARSQVVTVSAASGIDPPVAPVSVELRNLVAFKESTTALRRLGFVGRACVHPVQLGPVHEVFTPTQAELEHAHRTLAQLDEAGRQSSGVLIGEDGRLIDEAVARSARRLLESAKLR